MPSAPKVTWSKSPSPSTTAYQVAWTLNSAAAGSLVVASTAAGDTSGYAVYLSQVVPPVTVRGRDGIGASAAALDQRNALASGGVPSAPAAVSVPNPPPAPPTSVVLYLEAAAAMLRR